MKKGKNVLALALAALMLLLPGCGEEKEEEVLPTLRAYVCAEPETLDPAMNSDSGVESVLSTLYEGLMRVRDDGRGGVTVTEGVAKEYKVENNFDHTVTYTFTLRKSARWSDGQKVTADDFVYAWRRLADPALKSPNSSLLSVVSGYDTVQETGDSAALAVMAKDKSTFCVTLSAPCIYFLTTICTAPATAPLRADAESGSADPMLTNGPFTLSGRVPGQSLSVVRNPEYYESQRVTLEGVDFIFADDPDEAYKRFQNGEIDYLGRLSEKALAETAAGQEDFTFRPLAATCCVLFNHLSDEFSNLHLRKMFDMALDREAAAKAAGAGAVAATGLVPYGIVNDPSTPDDFRTVGGSLYTSYPENKEERLAAAKAQLTESGRRPSPFRLLYVEGSGLDEAAKAVAAAWKRELGIAVSAEGLTQEKYDERLASGEYDMALFELTGRYNDPMTYLAFLDSKHGSNLLGYHNATYDLLLGVADAATDMTARAAFLHDAEAMVIEDCAVSPLYFESTGVRSDGWTGILFDSLGHSYFSSAAPLTGEEA